MLIAVLPDPSCWLYTLPVSPNIQRPEQQVCAECNDSGSIVQFACKGSVCDFVCLCACIVIREKGMCVLDMNVFFPRLSDILTYTCRYFAHIASRWHSVCLGSKKNIFIIIRPGHADPECVAGELPPLDIKQTWQILGYRDCLKSKELLKGMSRMRPSDGGALYCPLTLLASIWRHLPSHTCGQTVWQASSLDCHCRTWLNLSHSMQFDRLAAFLWDGRRGRSRGHAS